MMKRKKRVLVLFILAVVLVCGLVLYNTPPAEKFHPLDGYTGKAPWDFGGLSDDGKTVFVTQTSLHTLSYWKQAMHGAENAENLVWVRYSFNKACLSMIEVKRLLKEEYNGKYTYRVAACALLLDEDDGYRIQVKLEREDAQLIFRKLQQRFGSLIVPYTYQGDLVLYGFDPGCSPGYPEEWKPLIPIVDFRSHKDVG